MRFQPKTEQQIQQDNLWPEGEYGFEIARAEDAVSKSGNDMIKLTLNVTSDNGRSMILFDYLMEAMAFKLRHCAEACDLLDKYEQGELNAIDFEGKTGTIKLIIQKDKTGNYPDKNSVKDYVTIRKLTEEQEKHTKAKGNAFVNEELDDDLPF